MRLITALIGIVLLTTIAIRANDEEAPSEAEIAFFLKLAAAEEEALILAQLQKKNHPSVLQDALETIEDDTPSIIADLKVDTDETNGNQQQSMVIQQQEQLRIDPELELKALVEAEVFEKAEALEKIEREEKVRQQVETKMQHEREETEREHQRMEAQHVQLKVIEAQQQALIDEQKRQQEEEAARTLELEQLQRAQEEEERLQVQLELKRKEEEERQHRQQEEEQAIQQRQDEEIARLEAARLEVAQQQDEADLRRIQEEREQEEAALERQRLDAEQTQLNQLKETEQLAREQLERQNLMEVEAMLEQTKRERVALEQAESEREERERIAQLETERDQKAAAMTAEQERMKQEADAVAAATKAQEETDELAAQQTMAAAEEERIRIEAAEQERMKQEAEALAAATKAQEEADELTAQQTMAAAEEERIRIEAAEQERMKQEADAVAAATKAQEEADELSTQQAMAAEEERKRELAAEKERMRKIADEVAAAKKAKKAADEFAAQGAKMEGVIAKLRKEAAEQDRLRIQATEQDRLRKEASHRHDVSTLMDIPVASSSSPFIENDPTRRGDLGVSMIPNRVDKGGSVGGCMVSPTMLSPAAIVVQENVNVDIASVSASPSTDIINGVDNMMHNEVTATATATGIPIIAVTADIHHTSNDMPIPSSSLPLAEAEEMISTASTSNDVLIAPPLGLEVVDEALVMDESQDIGTMAASTAIDTAISAAIDTPTAISIAANYDVISSLVEVNAIGEGTEMEHKTSPLSSEYSTKDGVDDNQIESNKVEEKREVLAEKVEENANVEQGEANEEGENEDDEQYAVDHLADSYIEDEESNDATIRAMLTFQQGNRHTLSAHPMNTTYKTHYPPTQLTHHPINPPHQSSSPTHPIDKPDGKGTSCLNANSTSSISILWKVISMRL